MLNPIFATYTYVYIQTHEKTMLELYIELSADKCTRSKMETSKPVKRDCLAASCEAADCKAAATAAEKAYQLVKRSRKGQ